MAILKNCNIRPSAAKDFKNNDFQDKDLQLFYKLNEKYLRARIVHFVQRNVLLFEWIISERGTMEIRQNI